MSVVLLRVGIDRACGGILGPIFHDGGFDFVPIDSDQHVLGRTYGNVSGRHGRKLIEYFPTGRRRNRMRDCFVHDDPEFKTFTYGDPTVPKQSLGSLESGDLLVFHAGLCGWNDCTEAPALYIIGYFEISCAGLYPQLISKHGQKAVERMFAKNWHILHGDTAGAVYSWRTASGNRRLRTELVLVKRGRGSRLLAKAVRLSAREKKLDKGGHEVFVLDPALRTYFGGFTKLNAIQRSIPRWVSPDFLDSAAAFVRRLR
jgi:hypothetical protein